MSDLIDRQAAKVNITRYFEVHIRNQKSRRLKEHAEEICRDICFGIDAWPSAQPERKKGKWIMHDEIKNVYGGVYIECSECGEKYVVQYVEDEKFCRNCGAEMKGEEE